MRTCPFHNCVQDLPDHLFACRAHWRLLSPAEQQRIHAAYHDYLADKSGVEELRQRQQDVLGNRGTA